MKDNAWCQAAKGSCFWTCLVICLAVILGGCQAKEAPLSKQAQVVKKTLLGEMHNLTGALAEPVAKQDWQALEPILQSSYQEMKKHRGFVPLRIVVLDRDGIIQKRFPPTRQEALDFSKYEPAKIVFEQKKITTARLYLEGEKIFIVMAPLLQQDQVTGAVAMGFSEEELKKWQVPEKEFLSIDFNQ